MKTFKRNAVIITVMLFVCAAVYLNWSYNRNVEEAAKAGTDGDVSALEPGGDGATEAGGQPSGGVETLTNVSPDAGAGLYYSVTNADNKDPSAGDGQSAAEPSAPDVQSSDTGKYAEYFAQVRLERAQARDEASATLSAVAQAEGASKETVDGALAAMTELAQNAMKESELESQIRSKGFIDCVVYLSDGGARVTVAAEGGLDKADVAKITDVMVSGAGIPVSKLTVNEIC